MGEDLLQVASIVNTSSQAVVTFYVEHVDPDITWPVLADPATEVWDAYGATTNALFLVRGEGCLVHRFSSAEGTWLDMTVEADRQTLGAAIEEMVGGE